MALKSSRMFDNICDGLVVVDSQSNQVRFLHDTAYDYFQNDAVIGGLTARESITLRCLSYLMMSSFTSGMCASDDEMKARLDTYPFYKYAALFWGHHARGDAWTLRVQEAALEFVMTKKRFRAAVQVSVYSGTRSLGFSKAHTDAWTALHCASSFGLKGLTKELIKRGIKRRSLDIDGKIALHIAARNGFPDVVRQLLRKDPETANIQDGYGQTSLHLAASNGHEATIVELLSRGSTVHSRNHGGQTALHMAIQNGEVATAKRLLEEFKSSPNVKDNDGRAPLHIASWKGDEESVKILISHGAKVQKEDNNGLTALHYTACMGHKAVAQLLLEHYKEVQVLDKGLWSPLHWAAVRKHDIMDPWTLYTPLEDGRMSYHSRAIDKKINQMLEVGEFVASSEGILANNLEAMVRGLRDKEQRKSEKGRYTHLAKPKEAASSFLCRVKGTSHPLSALLFTIHDEMSAMDCNNYCGHEGVIRLLLDKSISIDSPAQARWVGFDKEPGQVRLDALHLAMLSGHRLVAELLIQERINIHNLCEITVGEVDQGHSKGKFEALHIAIMQKDEQITRRLLETQRQNMPSDPNPPCEISVWIGDKGLCTPSGGEGAFRAIHLASSTTEADVLVPLLIEKGADVNCLCTASCDYEEFGNSSK
ncbi:hypothetical protein H9Q74_007336 [Fusarium xylarioides]|nr:hypothetical protein H9Q71_010209 [Fusarium xylarioides]KAG5822564.1 hypothetical protein H9Q74_007336 [Fusarium xylarioides]